MVNKFIAFLKIFNRVIINDKQLLLYMKKFFVLFILLAFSFINLSYSNESIGGLKDLESYIKTKKGNNVIRNNTNIVFLADNVVEETFFLQPIKVKTTITYSTLFNNSISTRNQNYFKRWKNYRNNKVNATGEIIEDILNNQLNSFYNEMVVFDGGKKYNLIITKSLAEQIKSKYSKNEKLNVNIIIFAYVNKNGANDAYVLVTSFEDYTDESKNHKNNFTDDYYKVKKSVSNGNYETAMAKLTNLIKQYPENKEYKKQYCNASLSKSLKYNTAISKELINCFLNLKEENDVEINYAIASLYSKLTSSPNSVRNKKIIEYTNKIIDTLDSKGVVNLNQTEEEIYYNSLYLRGNAKIAEKDSSGHADLVVCDERFNK